MTVILTGWEAKSRAKRLALPALGCIALSLAAALPAGADNAPHALGTGGVVDNCAACHRVHTAQAAPLLEESQTALCYTCHGSSGTGANTDVEDGVGYSGAGRTGSQEALRGGGFKYALIESNNPSGQETGGSYSDPNGVVPVRSSHADVTSTHSIDGSEQTDWGNGPISATANYGGSTKLRCGSCHNPHGDGTYRILRPIPVESGASGVTIPDTATKAYTTENYWQVADPNDPSFIAKISEWCATCHTRYLRSEAEAHKPTGDAIFTEQHVSDGKTQGSASCIQCHVAHGSNASVAEADSTAVHSPEGRSGEFAGPGSMLLRIDAKGTCGMCHK